MTDSDGQLTVWARRHLSALPADVVDWQGAAVIEAAFGDRLHHR
jgi:hypothetical protein